MNERIRVPIALFILYVVWGSTYLGMRMALEGFPPLLISGLRYSVAGAVLCVYGAARGGERPSLRDALVIGVLLCAANACVVVAEQWVSSGMAAVTLASMPLWVALIAGLFGKWPTGNEWIGLAVGLGGVAVLQTAGDLRASPAGALLLVVSCAAWSLGSVLSSRMKGPRGAMTSGAQMLAGGVVVLAVALLRGERVPSVPPARAVAALAYLTIFGSIVAYSAYQYLLAAVRPALATSYAYVNPIVALLLGAAVYGETVAPRSAFALVLILGGVALLALRRVPVAARLPDE